MGTETKRPNPYARKNQNVNGHNQINSNSLLQNKRTVSIAKDQSSAVSVMKEPFHNHGNIFQRPSNGSIPKNPYSKSRVTQQTELHQSTSRTTTGPIMPNSSHESINRISQQQQQQKSQHQQYQHQQKQQQHQQQHQQQQQKQHQQQQQQQQQQNQQQQQQQQHQQEQQQLQQQQQQQRQQQQQQQLQHQQQQQQQ